MKYVLVIADGAADNPIPALGGQTPFAAARKPHTDELARSGLLGTARTTPHGFSAGSDLCCLSLLGYDPAKYHRGRSPLEAAAIGVELEPTDWVYRCNLVTIEDGVMIDHSAGHIDTEDSHRLLADLAASIRDPALKFHPGVSYRNLMTDDSGRSYADVQTVPPHDIPQLPVGPHLPSGGDGADVLRMLYDHSESLFADHEINRKRREAGKRPATHVWLWGGGQKPQMPAFESMHGIRGGVITAVDLLAGIGKLIGLRRIHVPGITGYHDTDYRAKGEYAIRTLDELDFICVHVEAPDEASHQGDFKTKVASIEAIDSFIVGPLVKALRRREAAGEKWRFLYLPDHYTCVGTRKHDATPVPFLMAGHGLNPAPGEAFDEAAAGRGPLHLERGHELMERFLQA